MDVVHPGEVLEVEYLLPLKLTQLQLATEIGVPAGRINEIIHRKRRVTLDTALRLARYFGTTEHFWLDLQTRYDVVFERERIAAALGAIRPISVS
ncbi:HigA family addiction module antidote protein [Hoyosella rhizosphaerae]|uniref:Transcriptional regulator n=1 Tax=Hoyosella rhizosphaerae TaxID=1755582 RepID=A0A916U2V6_9ACTN|nr:HigA family addiction module antitoxin [Hoyosella rhizosphaerae]MBN4926657.1 HigA family addiction module antidote protein [Hoyosella rhizosphaerae]GGC57512.1 transcriptional regulator [Hoyosella rhizosphaerae]